MHPFKSYWAETKCDDDTAADNMDGQHMCLPCYADDTKIALCHSSLKIVWLDHFMKKFNPCPAKPGYTLPLQTV